MASPKDLLDWCRVTCTNYPGVEIKNMSSSFRDGLAFCAIIHKHRPDLIEFGSLSKDNVYQNNKLAFEIAETKLGIPALLDLNDLIAAKVPDCLTVIAYISHYYYLFNRKSCAGSSRSSTAKIKSPNGLKSSKSLTELETRQEELLAHTRTPAVCNLCLKSVHLIQRCLHDGKVYHRSCFRCKVCHCTLLFDSSTQGGDTRSLICTCHVTDSKAALSTDSRSKSQTGFYSLSGLAISSVPCYARKAESQDRFVSETSQRAEAGRQERSRGVKVGENPSHKDGTEKNQHVGDAEVCKKPSELFSACEVTEEKACPVPAPRRSLNSTLVPAPTPRTRTAQNCPAAEISKPATESPADSSHIRSSKVKTSHPWMAIVHPGPWSQLPPAPPPLSRSKLASNLHGSSDIPKNPPRNPFEEEDEEEIQGEAAECSVAAAGSKNEDSHDTVGSSDAKDPAVKSEGNLVKTPDKHFSQNALQCEGCKEAEADSAAGGGPGQAAVSEAASGLHSVSAQNQRFPRSLSVPETNSVPAGRHDADFCKKNFYTQRTERSKSETFQNLLPTRGPAPGHGFPLIRRKVQTDQLVSMEELQKQKKELDRHLEELEQHGVELEKNIRNSNKVKEKEEMLIEWIALFHERHSLLHQDRELVYLIKQQKLEDRQTDVEYELRCLLNKPESRWNQEDRDQEQQLMKELVTIIEQRNQIISSLDQDRQRDQEETSNDKDFQKDGLKELKKSKGKFKVFKKLNLKTE